MEADCRAGELSRNVARPIEQGIERHGRTADRVLRATANDGVSQADINRVSAGGSVDGRASAAIEQLRQDLVRVQKGNVVTITDKNGDAMKFDGRTYAEKVVRNKTRLAMVTSRLERFAEPDTDPCRSPGGCPSP